MQIYSINKASCNFTSLQNSITLRLNKKCYDCIKDKIGKDFFEKNNDIDFVLEADCCSKFKLIATNIDKAMGAQSGAIQAVQSGTNGMQSSANILKYSANTARYENHGDCTDFFKTLSNRNIKSDIEKSARVFLV